MLARLNTIEIMDNLLAASVDHHSQMYPETELIEGQRRWTDAYLVIARFGTDRSQSKHAVVPNGPVNCPSFEAVAHEERIDLVIQALHAHPRGERQGLVFAGNVESNTIVDAAKFKRVLVRPAPLSPLGTDDRSVGRCVLSSAGVAQPPFRSVHLLEIKVHEQ